MNIKIPNKKAVQAVWHRLMLNMASKCVLLLVLFFTAAPQLPLRMDCEIEPQNDITPQQVLIRIANNYLRTVNPSTVEEHLQFRSYLRDMRGLLIVDVQLGSLITTVECRSLQILEGLWEDYSTGHLNDMAQKYLVTEEILRECGLLEVKLTTTILEDDYRACREYFLHFPGELSFGLYTNGAILSGEEEHALQLQSKDSVKSRLQAPTLISPPGYRPINLQTEKNIPVISPSGYKPSRL